MEEPRATSREPTHVPQWHKPLPPRLSQTLLRGLQAGNTPRARLVSEAEHGGEMACALLQATVKASHTTAEGFYPMKTAPPRDYRSRRDTDCEWLMWEESNKQLLKSYENQQRQI